MSRLHQSDRIHRGGRFNSGPGKRSFGPKPPHGNPRYAFPVATRTIDTNSTLYTLSNTTTETTIIDLDIPALAMQNKGAVRLMASGSVANSAVAAGTVTFKLKGDDGGGNLTLLQTTAISASTSSNERHWILDATVFNTGTTVQTSWAALEMTAASTSPMTTVETAVVGNKASTMDETQLINLTVTAQLSGASANYTLYMDGAVLEAVT